MIASRPEAHIQEIFSDSLSKLHLGFPIDQSFDDVRKFLQCEFSRIHREHYRTMGAVPLPWPTKETIDQLIEKSSGHFIYASTVKIFIDDRNFRPTERLNRIMGISQPHGSGTPFSALDNLYTQILSEAVVDRPHVFELLAVIAAEIELPIDTIEQLLEWQSNRRNEGGVPRCGMADVRVQPITGLLSFFIASRWIHSIILWLLNLPIRMSALKKPKAFFSLKGRWQLACVHTR
jgi:hypothetical protein